MKTISFFLAFTLRSAGAYCQSKNNLSLVYGLAGNGIYPTGMGGAGYKGEGDAIYGLNYTRNISKSFSIETGMEYSVNNILWDYNDANPFMFIPQKASVRMLSVPVYANFTFSKYFFADAGLTFDFETSHQSDAIVDNQSGTGISLGIGGKYNFKKMTVFISPFLQLHSRLFDAGVEVGTGYNF